MPLLPASLVGLDSAGGGPILQSLQQAVFVNGIPMAVLGSPIAPHGPPPHSSAVIATGVPAFTINGLQLAILGKLASCGDTLTGSAPLFVQEIL